MEELVEDTVAEDLAEEMTVTEVVELEMEMMAQEG